MDDRNPASGFDEYAPELAVRKPTLAELTQALGSEETAINAIVPSAVIYGLSDLTTDELAAVIPIWDSLRAVVKERILGALYEASESMFELSFREIALLNLKDSSSPVRQKAVDLLWTDESVETMQSLMQLAESDTDSTVRTRALENLGRFLLLGEYGEIPADLAADAQAMTLAIHQDEREPIEIRRRALEALANSSHASVEQLIRAAYADGNQELRLAALFAMGRTCSKIWRDQLLDELENDNFEFVYEAIRACGHIQLEESVQRIAEYAFSEDQEIQTMAIWSLGEIGGRQAFEVLTRLDEDAEDDALATAIDEALDAASFSLSSASLRKELDDDW
jgi:HEAT repeat protein